MRGRDAPAAERRWIPWMTVEKVYEVEKPRGKPSLLDLFEGRRQVVVYRAFFEPDVSGRLEQPAGAILVINRGVEVMGPPGATSISQRPGILESQRVPADRTLQGFA